VAVPPADSPNSVIFCGSPPKAAILFLTHSTPARTSSRPGFCWLDLRAGLPGKPKTFRRLRGSGSVS